MKQIVGIFFIMSMGLNAASRREAIGQELRKLKEQLPAMRKEFNSLIDGNPVNQMRITQIAQAHYKVGYCTQARLIEQRLRFVLKDQQNERAGKMQKYEAERQVELARAAHPATSLKQSAQ